MRRNTMTASEVTRREADNLMERDTPMDPRISSDIFLSDTGGDETPVIVQRSSSAYTLAENNSLLSSDVDRWINGSTSPTGIPNQISRPAANQRSVTARISSVDTSGLWYVMAMLVPLFSFNSLQSPWRCSPSAIISTTEFCVMQVARVCTRVRGVVQRLAQDHLAREVFATAMDLVLVVYAIGFLVLSVYQASIFG